MKPLPPITEQIALIKLLKKDLENSPDLSDTLQHRIDTYEAILQNLVSIRNMEAVPIAPYPEKSESYHFGHGEKPNWMNAKQNGQD